MATVDLSDDGLWSRSCRGRLNPTDRDRSAGIRYDRSMEWSVVFRRKVRYSDTDVQGIVFNGNYLTYYDDALTDLIDDAGLTPTVLHDLGCEVVTAHASIDYRAPARLGDRLAVGARLGRVGTTSLEFVMQSWIEGSGRVTTDGKVVWVCVDREALRPMPVPEELVAAIRTLHAEPVAIEDVR
jgi:acyl-CoA thioester hydrolase